MHAVALEDLSSGTRCGDGEVDDLDPVWPMLMYLCLSFNKNVWGLGI